MGYGEFDDLLFNFDVFFIIVYVVSVWILWFYFFMFFLGNGFFIFIWNFSCNIGYNIFFDVNVSILSVIVLWGFSKRYYKGI